jgi:hypothetical protein
MSRDQPDGNHGFGICVKGGKETGNSRKVKKMENKPFNQTKFQVLVSTYHVWKKVRWPNELALGLATLFSK